jgi:hypothetical protein
MSTLCRGLHILEILHLFMFALFHLLS